MALAPAVGAVPGLSAAAVAAAAAALRLPAVVAAVLAVAAVALATRGMHLDGLADTADGLAAGYDRRRALDVMRRGDTGPAGAAALVLVLGLQIGALTQVLPRFGALGVAVAVAAGRAVLPVACARGVPSARSEGLGSTVAGSVRRAVAAGVVVATALAAALVLAATAAAGPGTARGWPAAAGTVPGTATAALQGAAAVVVAVGAAAVLARRAVTRFGGITGDVLGACVEVGTAAALVALAVGG